MKRVILTVLATLACWPVSAAGGAALLHCVGLSRTDAGTVPFADNIHIARDGGHIDFRGGIKRSEAAEGEWRYYKGTGEFPGTLTDTTLVFRYGSMEMTAVVRINGQVAESVEAACTVTGNPFAHQ